MERKRICPRRPVACGTFVAPRQSLNDDIELLMTKSAPFHYFSSMTGNHLAVGCHWRLARQCSGTGFPSPWFCIAILTISLTLPTAGLENTDESDPFRDPASISRVKSGRMDEARAEWWGFDPKDTTESLQDALDSGAKTVVISYVGRPWIVKPLRLPSDLTLRLEPGVVIQAARGAFQGKHDSLLIIEEVEDVRVIGYGATLRMHKDDYRRKPYEKSEWRHGISIKGSRRIDVIGLRIEGTGGDGIYVGPTWDDRQIPCERIRIRDCTCSESLRQGLSVVSGRDVRIENCLFQQSSGAAPQAGVDIEPANPRNIVIDVEVTHCQAIHNAGSGFMVNLSRLTDESAPASIRFSHCLTRGSTQPGLRALLDKNLGARGTVTFAGCTVEDTQLAGLALRWDMSSDVQLNFVECRWARVGLRPGQTPFHLDLRSAARPNDPRITFEAIRLIEETGANRPVFRLENEGQFNISGNLDVIGGKGRAPLSSLPDLKIRFKDHDQEP